MQRPGSSLPSPFFMVCDRENALRPAPAFLRRKPGGLRRGRHRCGKGPLQRCSYLGRLRGPRRGGLCADGRGSVHGQRQRPRLHRPCGPHLRPVAHIQDPHHHAFFGFALTIAQISTLWSSFSAIPPVYLKISPYLITLVVLIFSSKNTSAPRAEGKFFEYKK